MKIQDLEKISEYIDGESRNSLQMHSLIESDPLYRKAYQNLLIVSDTIRNIGESYIPSEAARTESFWSELEHKFNEEDEFLSSVLKLAQREFPPEYENLDLWSGIGEKINSLAKQSSVDEPVLKQLSPEIPSLNELLSESFTLPENLSDLDIWSKLEEKIDKQYHSELFSESASEGLTVKAKFFIGLSEYADGEVTAEKAGLINDHLITCSSCRNHYLSLLKAKDALKFAFKDHTPGILSSDQFWSGVELELFPAEVQPQSKKIQGL